MNTTRLKKLLILNTPYVVIGLYATKLGEAWRLAEGTDALLLMPGQHLLYRIKHRFDGRTLLLMLLCPVGRIGGHGLINGGPVSRLEKEHIPRLAILGNPFLMA